MYQIRTSIKCVFAAVTILLFVMRTIWVGTDLMSNDETALLSFPLAVIFPSTLIAALLLMQPAGTREGILMRLGTILQLLLIIALPGFALYLALGFPIVFLAVEIYETRFPKTLTRPVNRIFIT